MGNRSSIHSGEISIILIDVNFNSYKRVKVLLSNGANSARQWNPELRVYYDRKIQEGKEHNLVIILSSVNW